MRQNQALDFGVRRDLSDHGRRHVQASLDSDGSFRHRVVRNEQIGVRRQSDEAFTRSCGYEAGDEGKSFVVDGAEHRSELRVLRVGILTLD